MTRVQSTIKEKNFFLYYFRIEDEYVGKIYNFEKSLNKTDTRNPGILFGKRVEFDNLDIEEFNSDKLVDLENTSNTPRKYQNPIISKNVSILLEDNVKKEYEGQISPSRYKNYLIQKQISSALAKNNLSLSSLYNIPELEVMSSFLQHLNDKNSEQLFFNIVILSIILQQKVESTLLFLLAKHRNIQYSVRNKNITYTIPEGIFSNPKICLEDIAYRSEERKEKVELYLPDFLLTVIEQSQKLLYEEFKEYLLKKDISQKDENLKLLILKIYDLALECNSFTKLETKLQENIDEDEREKLKNLCLADSFLEEYTTYIDQNFNMHAKSYKKRIVCSIVALPKLSYHYFFNSSRKSAVIIKYLADKSKNDQVQLCYTAHKERLYELEEWNKELIKQLSIDAIYKRKLDESLEAYCVEKAKWRGSKYFIQEHNFKNFINTLFNCIRDTENRYIKDSLIMICIRYIFSIVFATRDNNFSALFTNYSLNQKIIIKQEKNKNIYTGVRLIPLTERGCFYMSLLKKIMTRHSLNTLQPVLLEEGQKVQIMNKKNLEEYLKKHCQHIKDIDKATDFVKYTKLNMGRHIFSSYCVLNNSLNAKYIDAFLNHFHAGNEDQGIYSDFDNTEYQNEVRTVIEEIESKYFTSDMDEDIAYAANN